MMSDENNFNLFLCQLCTDAEPMEPKAFIAHRQEVHGLTEHSGRKRMTMHLDARDWHETTYEWRNAAPQQVREPPDDTIFALQTVRISRHKDDPMRDIGGMAQPTGRKKRGEHGRT